jgi:ribosomal protein S12 methylthiotransferase
MPNKNFSILSLGCFRNTYDSKIVAERLFAEGYKFLPQVDSLGRKPAKLDTLIINTCGFITQAKEESLAAINEAIKLKRTGRIKNLFVFGCLTQRYRKELEKFFPEVDKWWGIEKPPQNFPRKNILLPRHIDFIKICEGCLNRCSYCAIPLIKGGLLSRRTADIIKEARYREKCKVKELNVIGQDISSWGKDLKKEGDLTALLKAILSATKTIPWIRLFYLHPLHVTDSLLDLIAREKRLCKYIDLPIQHINDRILKLMHRPITKKETLRLIAKIRKKIPGCVIRTSVIVGFPTETEKEFIELLDFLKEAKLERLGAFIYSREENTPAYNFTPQVHPKVKERRFSEVMRLQQNISREANKALLGKEIEVLVEAKDNGIFIGRSQYDGYDVDGIVYLRKKNLKIGEFYKTKIVDSYEYDLVGV